jgi:hypothetical protein
MSATRDKSQKTTFVYSNLYSIYRKGKEAAVQAPSPLDHLVQPQVSESAPAALPGLRKVILKAGELGALQAKTEAVAKPEIREYRPVGLINKRIARPAVIGPKRDVGMAKELPSPHAAVESLKQNLKSLNDLHGRLRFMLQELEDLVKSDKE